MKNILPEVESYPHTLAILLGCGIKKIEAEKPYFDFAVEKQLEEKLENYQQKKEELLNEIRKLVTEGVKEYREGKIHFRF